MNWSSRDSSAYQQNGARLLKLYSGGGGAIQDVLEECLAAGELPRLRAVARTLKELGYSDFFLRMAKRLLEVTDDALVKAYLEGTVGSTGVVVGSLLPEYEKRKADMEAWLGDPGASPRTRVFARQQVVRLTRQIELHAEEDWDE